MVETAPCNAHPLQGPRRASSNARGHVVDKPGNGCPGPTGWLSHAQVWGFNAEYETIADPVGSPELPQVLC